MFGRAPDVLDFWSLEPPYCRSCDASLSLDADALDAELYPTSYVAPYDRRCCASSSRSLLPRVFIAPFFTPLTVCTQAATLALPNRRACRVPGPEAEMGALWVEWQRRHLGWPPPASPLALVRERCGSSTRSRLGTYERRIPTRWRRPSTRSCRCLRMPPSISPSRGTFADSPSRHLLRRLDVRVRWSALGCCLRLSRGISFAVSTACV